MTENLPDSQLTSFADHLNEQYGERGTPAREEFEEESNAFISIILQDTHAASNLPQTATPYCSI